jgi:transcriptional regulator with XRE-family HTH domain
MGRSSRRKPSKLHKKLRKIRTTLHLSQNGMIQRLEVPERLTQFYISGFESGDREPSLTVLLHYARVAGVCVDVLIDDKIDLPTELPAKPKHKGVKK